MSNETKLIAENRELKCQLHGGAKPLGLLTDHEKSYVVNSFLTVVREIGGYLGGERISDVLVRKYPTWEADKIQAAADYIRSRDNVRAVLAAEGIDCPAMNETPAPDLSRETDYVGSHALEPPTVDIPSIERQLDAQLASHPVGRLTLLGRALREAWPTAEDVARNIQDFADRLNGKGDV